MLTYKTSKKLVGQRSYRRSAWVGMGGDCHPEATAGREENQFTRSLGSLEAGLPEHPKELWGGAWFFSSGSSGRGGPKAPPFPGRVTHTHPTTTLSSLQVSGASFTCTFIFKFCESKRLSWGVAVWVTLISLVGVFCIFQMFYRVHVLIHRKNVKCL